MPRPHRSIKDRWLDEFADFDADTQEHLIDICGLLHRQTRRREAKAKDGAEKPRQPELPGTGTE